VLHLIARNVEYMQSRRLRASNLSNCYDFEVGYNCWIYYYFAYFVYTVCVPRMAGSCHQDS